MPLHPGARSSSPSIGQDHYLPHLCRTHDKTNFQLTPQTKKTDFPKRLIPCYFEGPSPLNSYTSIFWPWDPWLLLQDFWVDPPSWRPCCRYMARTARKDSALGTSKSSVELGALEQHADWEWLRCLNEECAFYDALNISMYDWTWISKNNLVKNKDELLKEFWSVLHPSSFYRGEDLSNTFQGFKHVEAKELAGASQLHGGGCSSANMSSEHRGGHVCRWFTSKGSKHVQHLGYVHLFPKSIPMFLHIFSGSLQELWRWSMTNLRTDMFHTTPIIYPYFSSGCWLSKKWIVVILW